MLYILAEGPPLCALMCLCVYKEQFKGSMACVDGEGNILKAADIFWCCLLWLHPNPLLLSPYIDRLYLQHREKNIKRDIRKVLHGVTEGGSQIRRQQKNICYCFLRWLRSHDRLNYSAFHKLKSIIFPNWLQNERINLYVVFGPFYNWGN